MRDETPSLTPAEQARLLRLLGNQIPQLTGIESDAAAWLREFINQAATAAARPVVFELDPHGFYIDGRRVSYCGRGIAVAWTVLVAQQYRIAPLRPEWFFNVARPSACARQALERAADAVESFSRPLAAAIRSIGVERTSGVLAVKHDRLQPIRCTMTDDMLALARSAPLGLIDAA